MKQTTIDSLERVWARSLGHKIGENDFDIPSTPILSLCEARISLVLRTCWVVAHVLVLSAILINIKHHW